MRATTAKDRHRTKLAYTKATRHKGIVHKKPGCRKQSRPEVGYENPKTQFSLEGRARTRAPLQEPNLRPLSPPTLLLQCSYQPTYLLSIINTEIQKKHQYRPLWTHQVTVDTASYCEHNRPLWTYPRHCAHRCW